MMQPFTHFSIRTGIGALASLLACMPAVAAVSVKSPDTKTVVRFDLKSGALEYAVQRNGSVLIESSPLSIVADKKTKILSHELSNFDSTWKPVWGQFSEIRDHHNQLSAKLDVGGTPVTLLCRVFDDGMGIRFKFSDSKEVVFQSGFNVAGKWTYYYPNGEKGVSEKSEKGKKGKKGGKKKDEGRKAKSKKGGGAPIPVVGIAEDGSSIAILESDLYSAQGFSSMKLAMGEQGMNSTSSLSGPGAGLTPWRVILWGESPGALLESNVTVNLAAPSKMTDSSWVRAGKSLWDWRIHGYNNGEFVYGIDTRSYLRLIDFAAAQGIEYFTVDDHWYKKAGSGKMTVSPEVDIQKVMGYAKQKGVKILLYYDRKKGNFGDDTLFSHYAGLGARGMKYGFMANNANFTRAAIDAGAENKLLMNFHDNPVPMVGVERTMPNLITREYCHAQQDSRRAYTPETFIEMAMVNALTGPLDMANGNFGIRSINAGERQKGPRQKNSYISTVVSECARTLVIYSGLVTLPDAPEEYLKKEDLFQFLKLMPATWDETRVPNSLISTYITTARRSGETWFIGSVNNQKARDLKIKLDFLKPGTEYEVTYFTDAPDAHGVKNPEAYAITKGKVKAGEVVTASMAVGGGHAMILKPAK